VVDRGSMRDVGSYFTIQSYKQETPLLSTFTGAEVNVIQNCIFARFLYKGVSFLRVRSYYTVLPSIYISP